MNGKTNAETCRRHHCINRSGVADATGRGTDLPVHSASQRCSGQRLHTGSKAGQHVRPRGDDPAAGPYRPLHRTFPASTLHTCDPEVVHDVHNDTRLSLPERSLAAELDIQSFVAIPLLHNGASIGVLTVVSAQPSVFDESAVAALASMSRLVAALIGSHSELSRLLHDLFEKAGATSHGDSTTAFLAELFVPGVPRTTASTPTSTICLRRKGYRRCSNPWSTSGPAPRWP